MPSERPSRTTLALACLVGLTAWLSFGVLAVLETDGTRVGVLPSVFLLVLALATAIAAVARWSWLAAPPLWLLALVLLPWLPLPMPALGLVWTGPVLLMLWGGCALYLVAVVVQRRAASRLARAAQGRAAPLIAAGLAFVAFIGIRLGTVGPPGGDEPHYLVIAQSLLQDGDLEVANNYERQDYLQYWGAFRPHLSPPGQRGDQYSVHAPGVPVLIAPAYAIGGYRAVVIWIAAIVAIGSALVWKAAHLVTGDTGAAWFAWAAVALTSPVALHGTLIYPDPIGGVMIAAGMLALIAASRLTQPLAAADEASRYRLRWFAAGLAIGSLPWLHTRLALPAAALAVLLLLRLGAAARRRTARWNDWIACAAPIVASLTGWLVFFRIAYGTFDPSAPYGAQLPIDASHVATGFLGLAVDQQFGLLPNAPVHILWAAGLWSLFKRERRLAIELLLVVSPYILASSGFPMWFGGGVPPARFLVPIVFPFGLALAAFWAQQDAGGRSMSLGLLGLSALIAVVLGAGGDGQLAYNSPDGRARWLDWIAPLVDLPGAFPGLFRPGDTLTPRAGALERRLLEPALLWFLSVAGGWVLFRLIVSRLKEDVALRALATGATILAVLAGGAMATWSLSAGAHLASTRSQLRLLEYDNPARRPIGVRLPRLEMFPAAHARARLALSQPRLDRLPQGTLLQLAEVPPGDYQLRLDRGRLADGKLAVGVGRATGTLWEGMVADGSAEALTLRLPVRASIVTVKGDDSVTRSIEAVWLVPSARGETPFGSSEERAQDAVRYGQVIVFAIDQRVKLDAAGLWVLGGRQPEVVVTTDGLVGTLALELQNVALENQVRVSAGRWSAERHLAPNEIWRVRVPVAGLGRAFHLGFKVERGLPPAEGSLGCRIQFR